MNRAKLAIAAITALWIGQVLAADALFVPGQAHETSWATLAEHDHRHKTVVGALSRDQSMEMQIAFEQLIGSPQLFLKLFDVPAQSCGDAKDDGEPMSKASAKTEAMTINGQQYSATVDCDDGFSAYVFHGEAAAHAITQALWHGETVTVGLPSGDGIEEHRWSAENFKSLAAKSVEAYEDKPAHHGQ
ncbi:hypothetical protein V5738_02970 [Salinisphaera sp. SPP-AMP-43]|uniref:hypothetical protein n=1 Tax=Salinisphaera sp. SPP-AMP-43 TaxID=3121288 RepID=UPI003C6E9A1A